MEIMPNLSNCGPNREMGEMPASWCDPHSVLLLQLTDRVRLLLMPAKHQPDLAYLRHVPLRRVHLFTIIQLLCLALLWVVKSTVAAIIFPVMVRDPF